MARMVVTGGGGGGGGGRRDLRHSHLVMSIGCEDVDGALLVKL